MIFQYGTPRVPADWRVSEKNPPGYCRIYHVLSGDVIYRDADSEVRLEKEHVYIFPSDSAYEMRQDPENPLECSFIHLDISPAKVSRLISIDMGECEFTRGVFAAIRAAVNDESGARVRKLVSAFEIFCSEKGYFDEYDPRILPSVSYICNNIKSRITVTDIAGVSGYHEQYFIKLFRQSTGVTPHRFLVNQRLKEARRLLSEELTITEIAERTGFSEVNSFCRAFRSEFGISPSEFRKSDISP